MANLNAKKGSGFAQGSGCYTCQACGRKTRERDGETSCVGIRLCQECYELGGIENSMQDGDESLDLLREAKFYFDKIAELGGKPEFIFADRFSEL